MDHNTNTLLHNAPSLIGRAGRESSIAIIGAGNMGGAIAEALLKNGGHKVTVSNRSAGKLERFVAAGASVTTDNCLAAKDADLVIIAVKPWLVEDVLNELINNVDFKGKTIVSVAASTKGEQLCQWAGEGPQILTAIPNTAIVNLASMTFLVPVRAEERTVQQVKDLFDTMGQTLVTDEAHLAAGTALASCGIAYALRYVRAATEGGVQLGFRAAEAQAIVVQTIRGAASLLEADGAHAETEIDKVTTPGGLTIRGLNAMEEAGFTNAVIQGQGGESSIAPESPHW